MKKLRFLLLEDLVADAELIIKNLKKNGFEFESHLVDNREDFIKALDEFKPDVVISDYGLPQYDGISAVQDLQELHPEIPFIIVTGSLDEETAADTIKQGAWDYVVKERLYRLPSAVSQVLKLKEEASKRKYAQKALKESENEIESLRNNVPLALFRSTAKGELILANPAFYEMFQIEDGTELSGINVKQFYKFPEDRIKLVSEVKKNKVIKNYEIELIRSDGKSFWASFDAQGIFDDKDNLVYQDGIISDVTEVKKAREELIKAKEKAEESDRLKTSFLANMSHEIRTPLNAIIGFSSLLLDPSYSQNDIADFVERIQNSSDSLLNIISDILDVAKIEAGAVTLEKKPTDINKLLLKVYDSFSEKLIHHKEIKLNLKIDNPSDELIINADETRLVQIFNNLLSNAFKFTKTGNIDFGYDIQGDTIEFFVSDTGIGIPEDKRKIIFDMFRQVDDSHTRLYGGTGLGLTIVKNLVEKMDGKIWVESELDKGSVFKFYIPVDKVIEDKEQGDTDPSEESRKTYDFSSKTLLVCEDDDSNYEYLETILLSTSANILRAADGKTAIDLCRNNKKIHLVLMDIQMPNINGYEAIEEIRKFNKEVPIIIQTAYAMRNDIRRFKEVDCNDYLVKPMSKKNVLAMVDKYIRS